MGALGLTFTPCLGARQGLGQFSPLPWGNVSQGALSALQAQVQWRVGHPSEAIVGTATRLRTLAVGPSQLKWGGRGEGRDPGNSANRIKALVHRPVTSGP